MSGDVTPACILIAAAALVPARRWVRLTLGGVGAVLLIGIPLVIAAAALGGGWMAWRHAIERANEAKDAVESELLAIDLMVLGVGGGLSFHQAAGFAARAVGDPVRRDLEARLRRFHIGVPTVRDDGDRDGHDRPIDEAFAVARRSDATGSALGPALGAVADTARHERMAAERRRLARLPTTLLFPLAFLILPGFVLMAVGPAVVSGLSRLSV